MTRTVTLAGYVLLAAASLAYELAGHLRRRTPTLGQAVLVLTRRRTPRALVLVGWLWLGWHLFVRGPA
ncbi:MAG: DUF6186 family protein [Actinomycetota bacterium]|nr:DUF6186 family protein [Actinomycetota bacterium]